MPSDNEHAVDNAAPASQLVYRYDAQPYADGESINSRGDHFYCLTDAQQKVEALIRSTMANGEKIRSTCLYTWQNLAFATQAARLAKKHLYQLEIDTADIMHRG